MQKRSVSGGAPSASTVTSAVDAMAALTVAIQELQAVMKALAGSAAGNSNGTDATDMADRSALALPTPGTEYPIPIPGSPSPLPSPSKRRRDGTAEAEREAFDEETVRAFDIPEAHLRAALAHGLENELPALSANRPAAFLQADSVQLANLRHAMRGEARSETHAADMPDIPYAPTSHVVDNSATERLAEAIGRLAEAILHGGGRSGSALHPGEASGGLNGLLQAARIAARPDGYN